MRIPRDPTAKARTPPTRLPTLSVTAQPRPAQRQCGILRRAPFRCGTSTVTIPEMRGFGATCADVETMGAVLSHFAPTAVERPGPVRPHGMSDGEMEAKLEAEADAEAASDDSHPAEPPSPRARTLLDDDRLVVTCNLESSTLTMCTPDHEGRDWYWYAGRVSNGRAGMCFRACHGRRFIRRSSRWPKMRCKSRFIEPSLVGSACGSELRAFTLALLLCMDGLVRSRSRFVVFYVCIHHVRACVYVCRGVAVLGSSRMPNADADAQQSSSQYVRREDASHTVDAAERTAAAFAMKQPHPLRAGMDAALAASDAAFLTRPILAIVAEYVLTGPSRRRCCSRACTTLCMGSPLHWSPHTTRNIDVLLPLPISCAVHSSVCSSVVIRWR